jgi:hypothetical protein
LITASPLGVSGGLARPEPNPPVPGLAFGALPEDCAVPALLVPRGEAPLCANDVTGAEAIAAAAIKTMADILVIGASPFMIQPAPGLRVPAGTRGVAQGLSEERMRKLIAFDDDTAAKLKQLARDRMATFQELADEAFADLLKKHGIPIDLKDALKKSARAAGASAKVIPLKKPAKKR